MSTKNNINIAGYSIERKIGEGGMADVYLAKQVALDRPVALKVMFKHLSQDAGFGARFLQEARCIANLDHPNIVPVYEVGQSDQYYFLSMALLNGGDLKKRIAQGLDESLALDITRKIASALGVAHEKGVVHRDIKPQNILFRQDGTPLLTDFGIAKVAGDNDLHLTMTGMMVGSPYYLSPEQALAQPVDQRSDIYSLGVVLYEMLTGSLPFKADSAVATAMQHVTASLPELPDQFQRAKKIVSKMLAKDPRDRFNSVHDLISSINEVLPKHQELPVLDECTVIAPAPSTVKISQNHDSLKSTYESSQTQIPNAAANAVPDSSSQGEKSKVNFTMIISLIGCVIAAVLFVFLYTDETQQVAIQNDVSEKNAFPESLSEEDPHTNKVNGLVSKSAATTDENSAQADIDSALPALENTVTPKRHPAIDGLLGSFVPVPSGTFQMGIKKAGVVDARPVHDVTLKAFRISKFPITNEEYAVFDPKHKYLAAKKRHPATFVSWNDANRFAEWLSKQESGKYRLPTESEWEYAAKAHQEKDFPWGNRIGTNNANCDGCGSEWDGLSTSAVGSFSANNLGIYDLIGNVWEWTADCYAPSYQNASSTGLAYQIPGCDRKSLRGGSWSTSSDHVHPAYRGAALATARVDNVGFRLVQFK